LTYFPSHVVVQNVIDIGISSLIKKVGEAGSCKFPTL